MGSTYGPTFEASAAPASSQMLNHKMGPRRLGQPRARENTFRVHFLEELWNPGTEGSIAARKQVLRAGAESGFARKPKVGPYCDQQLGPLWDRKVGPPMCPQCGGRAWEPDAARHGRSRGATQLDARAAIKRATRSDGFCQAFIAIMKAIARRPCKAAWPIAEWPMAICKCPRATCQHKI